MPDKPKDYVNGGFVTGGFDAESITSSLTEIRQFLIRDNPTLRKMIEETNATLPTGSLTVKVENPIPPFTIL